MHRDWSLLAELLFGLVHLSNEVDKPFARLGNSLQNPKNMRSNILCFNQYQTNSSVQKLEVFYVSFSSAMFFLERLAVFWASFYVGNMTFSIFNY